MNDVRAWAEEELAKRRRQRDRPGEEILKRIALQCEEVSGLKQIVRDLRKELDTAP